MTAKELLELFAIIVGIGNTTWIILRSWKELRPDLKKKEVEIEKTDAEIETEFAKAAQTTVEGASISSTLLMERIKELRDDLENEKAARRADAQYFRRRFREAEREARDYRNWAAALAKQVIELGKKPIEFVPSSDMDSQKLRALSDDEIKRADNDYKDNNG